MPEVCGAEVLHTSRGRVLSCLRWDPFHFWNRWTLQRFQGWNSRTAPGPRHSFFSETYGTIPRWLGN